MNNEIAVLIPCFNESQTIDKVIKDIKNVLPEAKVYVYDNNSSDGTDIVAANAGAIVRYEKRQGKGNVIRTMFREIDANCYLIIDGDDTYPVGYANEMVNLVLKEHVDMVIGDRLSSTYFAVNKRLFHNFGNKLVQKLVNIIFKGKVSDIMTGYRAFGPAFTKTFPIMSKGFEIETEMTIHAIDKNMYIKSIPVSYRDRPEGSISKLNTYYDGARVMLEILRLFKELKPLLFFGIISTVMILVAFGAFIPILYEYIYTGLVARFPTLIICVFLSIISIQLLTCGIILDFIARKDRKNFEIQLNIFHTMQNKLY